MRKNRFSRGYRSVFLGGARVGLHGGLLKDGEGHTGGESGSTGDNSGGNPGDSNPQGGGENNNRQSFDGQTFWNDPDDQNNSSDSNTGPTDEQFLANLLQTGVTGYTGAPIFDAEIAGQLAEGNLEGVNQRMQAMQQGVLRQSMLMMAQILSRFEGQVDQRINGAITQNSTQRDDTSMLAEAFPSYAKREMQPVIKGVFAQSLKHTKGDRSKAIEMTRGMLQTMGQLGGQDFGIPPMNPDDSRSTGPSSLVQELLSM